MSSTIHSNSTRELDRKCRGLNLNIKPVIPLRETFSTCLIPQGDHIPKELILQLMIR